MVSWVTIVYKAMWLADNYTGLVGFVVDGINNK
jgi:hypothetical protein